MARARSPEKRASILLAAAEEIAGSGLGAPTSRIAARAGVAEGTVFTYFATKDELFNELYLELKSEVYARIHDSFPHGASLEGRARHVWAGFLLWGIEFPAKRRAAVQLSHSEILTPETRRKSSAERGEVESTFAAISRRATLGRLPPGFAAAAMAALQETTLDFIGKHPRRRAQITEDAFRVFWRAVR